MFKMMSYASREDVGLQTQMSNRELMYSKLNTSP